jgi:hypothetical protein
VKSITGSTTTSLLGNVSGRNNPSELLEFVEPGMAQNPRDTHFWNRSFWRYAPMSGECSKKGGA